MKKEVSVNIDSINIYDNYFFTIKMVNKKAFIKNILQYANNDFLFRLLNKKLIQLNELTFYHDEYLYKRHDSNLQILKTIEVSNDEYENKNSEIEKRHFTYSLLFNPLYEPNQFVKSATFVLNFDIQTYLITGGMSWQLADKWLNNLAVLPQYQECYETNKQLGLIFFNQVVNNFFKELFQKLAFIDLANLLKDNELHSLHKLYLYTNQVYSINTLYQQFTAKTYQSLFYLFFKIENEYQKLAHQIFDFFVLLFLHEFSLCRSLIDSFYFDNQVSSNKVNATIKSWIHHFNLHDENQNKLNVYFNHQNNDLNDIVKNTAAYLVAKNRKTFNKQYDSLSKIAQLTRNTIFLSEPGIIYEFDLNHAYDYLNKRFYAHAPDLLTYSIALLHPDYFLCNDDACLATNYLDFVNHFNYLINSETINDDYFVQIIEHNFLFNNYYSSSFAKNNVSLIFHDEFIDNDNKTLILEQNLLISGICLGKELNLSLLYEQWRLGMQKTYIRTKFLYSQIEQETKDLASDSNLQDLNSTYRKGIDHYEHHLHTQFNVKMLNSDVNLKNEFDKRQRFIEIIIVGFIVASLISLVDYATMIGSTLGVSCSGYGAHLWGALPNPDAASIWNQNPSGGAHLIPHWITATVIGVSTVVTGVNTVILVVSLGYLMYAYKKNKGIDKRKGEVI